MTVSLGNGVDIGNLVTAQTNPLTGLVEVSTGETFFISGQQYSYAELLQINPADYVLQKVRVFDAIKIGDSLSTYSDVAPPVREGIPIRPGF